ncbi:8-amino-7-oxononanoate synthase [Lindgomyces ingoldianus]|uniref:8-amino-7-oxononanoate synthase n=1 Tax=Lindgomyces ingoldianus TaxID=673940 RepID=A0ACB6Q7T9_9PLEO|nr:8-amino-7-oxononanoate synthase [Lindgomyces ingoldianus]KAF2462909.1 8-amino-7-oxononanoate synthase [Lindgomyces ingoldianus]
MAYYKDLFREWAAHQALRRPSTKQSEPAFYRRLEQALDVHRENGNLAILKPRWDDSVIDFTSSDFLSLSRSGRIRNAFLQELASLGNDWRLSASGSRTQYGNYDYLRQVEAEIAAFHGAETAWVCHSGFFANISVLEAVALPGDAIVWDELSHASTVVGLRVTVAAHKLPFQHNNPDALREVLTRLKTEDPAFARGDRSVLICVESIYSMEGDMCPLREMVAVAKDMFPTGNAQFVIDEAHSNGIIGPNGAGLVQVLGLEKDIAIRVHMCSKALASTGGVILCNKTVRAALTQFSRCLTYSGAPSVPMVASIRAAYQMLGSGQAANEQAQLQANVKYFFQALLEDPDWEEALDEGLLSVPLAEEWEERSVQSHVIPIKVRPGHESSLFVHLLIANINAYPISYPTVPRGTALIRLVFHAHNTRAEIDYLLKTIGAWVVEMLSIERGESSNTVPAAQRQFLALQANGWK